MADIVTREALNKQYKATAGEGVGDALLSMFSNQNRDPVTGFNFWLRAEFAFDVPCKSIRAFTKENEFEEIREGGLNDYVHLRRKPISHRHTFQVERYVGLDITDPLSNGTEFILPLLLCVNRYYTTDLDSIRRIYAFTGAVVTGKEYGALDAENSSLLTEITTIAYRELLYITVPTVNGGNEPWSFYDHKGESNAREKKYSVSIMDSWDKEKAKPSLWKFNVPKEEKRVSHAKTPASIEGNERGSTKATPALWDFKETHKNAAKVVEPQTEGGQSGSEEGESKEKGGPAVLRAKTAEGVFGNERKSTKATPVQWQITKGNIKNVRGLSRGNKESTKPEVVVWEFKKDNTKNVRGQTKTGERESSKAEPIEWKFEKDNTENVRRQTRGEKESTKAEPVLWKLVRGRTANVRAFKIEGMPASTKAVPVKWKFAKGNTENVRRQTNGEKESTKAEVVVWEFKKDNTKNVRGQSKTGERESTKPESIEWKFGKDNTENIRRQTKTGERESTKAVPVKWKFAKGSTKNVRGQTKTGEKNSTKPESIEWKFEKGKTENVRGQTKTDEKESTKAVSVKWKFAKGSTENVRRQTSGEKKSTKAVPVKWKFAKGNTENVRRQINGEKESTAAVQREWDIHNPTENTSARTIRSAADVAKFLSRRS